jgi:hypothetical protein
MMDLVSKIQVALSYKRCLLALGCSVKEEKAKKDKEDLLKKDE